MPWVRSLIGTCDSEPANGYIADCDRTVATDSPTALCVEPVGDTDGVIQRLCFVYCGYNIHIMCGRYSLAIDYGAIHDRFVFMDGLQLLMQHRPRFNIAPTQEVLTVVNPIGEGNEPRMMKWGLIPFWAKDPSIGNRMINARAETIAEKPAFREAFQRRRCLVVADGFYKWRKEGKYKVPMRIMLKTGEPFGFAGLWETWKSPEGAVIESCTIITTTPNALMEPIHNRMPAILLREVESAWLDPTSRDVGTLKELLVPYVAEEMDAYEVPTLVNAPKNDVPDVLERLS